MFKLKGALGIQYKSLILQMGKLRSWFRDLHTAGKDHNSDLPAGSEGRDSASFSLFIVSMFPVHFEAQAPVRC